MVSIKKVVTAQQSGVQTAGSSRPCAACIDPGSSTGIRAEVVTRLRPAALEGPGSRFPLTGQSAADRVGKQVVGVSGEIQAGQGATHLGLRREQCRGHAITPRVSSTSANAESTNSSWSPSRTGSSETR